ncbi:MAG: HAD-IA family hydrolase [Kofleriaceae bacterium]
MTAPGCDLLVLDGQGVTFTDPFGAWLDDLADATASPRPRIRSRWHDELRERAWRGEISDDALWAALAGADGAAWGARLEAAYRPGPAAAHLARWAARVEIWLLSNHRTPWIEARLRRFDLRRYFARLLVSDGLGALKPSPAVFAPVLADRRHPERVLFVDDQAKNVAAARALGLSAVLADPGGRWRTEVERRLRGGKPHFT